MFLIDMNFNNLEEITPELTKRHKAHLDREYKSKKLMFGGRKIPRTGGIIISKHSDIETLKLVLNEDPFIKSGAVSYSITEFDPVMASEEFEQVLL